MDLELYLNPINFDDFPLEKWANKKYALGTLLEKNSQKLSIDKADLLLIGVEEDRNAVVQGSAKSPNKIREHLYSLNRVAPRFKILDLGNVKVGQSAADTYFALKDLCTYFLELQKTVVILGGSQDLTLGITKAFEDERYNLATVDPKLDFVKKEKSINSENYLNFIFEKQPNLFSHVALGYQNYFTDALELTHIIDYNSEAKRLGDLRYNMAEIEPYLRASDVLSFDLNSVRHIEAPGQYFASPNGLYAEEACQVAHYAGMADLLKIAGFFNLIPELDCNNQASKLMAQVVWHFIEGFHFKVVEDPNKHPEDFNEYLIEMDDVDLPLTFYQSRKTGRWWMNILSETTSENYIIPCSQNDYDLASRYEIPDRWWRNIRKLNQLAK